MRLRQWMMTLIMLAAIAGPARSAVVELEWQIGIVIATPTTITASATITPTTANTATMTPTATITSTPTITPTGVPIQVWHEAFLYSDDDPPSAPGSQPPEWCDEDEDANNNTDMVYAETDGLAEITVLAGETWGKVVSWHREIDVDVYPYLQVNVPQVNATRLRFGVFRQPWEEHFAPWIESPGVYCYDIRGLTGWSGVQSQAGVEIIVEGSNASVVIDDIFVYGYGFPTPTETVTPTSTHTQTITPTSTLTVELQAMTVTPTPPGTATPELTQTCTATATMPAATSTMTATSTPFVKAYEIRAYPNPARNTVSFAYTVSGPGKVKIDIYKLTGERVASIVESIDGGAGRTLNTAWDAARVSPGIYFCRIVITDSNGNVVLDQKKKVALIR